MRRRHFRCDSCLRFDRYTTKGFPGWRAESTACRAGTRPIPGTILDSETAAMFRPTRPRFAIPRLVTPACLAALVAACIATPALAGVTWHPDLAAARAASATSQKPVLAVFTAGWSPESTRFADHTLTSPEATALITACFEPVRIDVDAQPEITKRLRVAHVPSACVVAANDEPLAAFDCPEPPPEFVAAAARAAQDAAVMAAATTSPIKVERMAHAVVPATRTQADLTAVGFAGTTPAGDAASLPGGDAVPTGKGSISLVTAKVRQLATFASGSLPSAAVAANAHAGPATPTMPIAGHLDPTSNVNRLVVATSAEPPALPRTPPTWPAEAPAAAPAFTNAALPQQPVRASIEPVQSASVTTPASPAAAAGSWLAQPVAPPQPAPQAAPATASVTPPPTEPDSSASVSDLPEKAPKPSAWSSFVAAMQKPFTAFTKPAAKPVTTPTLPPVWPTSPLAPKAQPGSAVAQQPSPPAAATPSPTPTMPTPAPTTPAAGPSATAQAAPPAIDGPDRHGSMPLGLEGYCPVTLADRGVWTEGRAQWGARHRGRTYLFAGPEQQQAFLANPDRYAPALSGDDPVMAFDQGRTTPGRRAYGVTYQSRMYLFSSPETKAAFTANPDRYTTNVVLAERPTTSGDATRRY
jgi:YHS domain-containing protein